MSGMVDTRLRWWELSEDEGREMKKRGETTQEASSPSLGCLAVTSASLLSFTSILLGPEEIEVGAAGRGGGGREGKMRGF